MRLGMYQIVPTLQLIFQYEIPGGGMEQEILFWNFCLSANWMRKIRSGKIQFLFSYEFPTFEISSSKLKKAVISTYISLFRTLSYITLCIHTMIAIPSAVSTRKGQLFKVRFKIFVYIFLIQSYPFIWQQVGKGCKNIIFCSHINQSQITYKH